MLKILSEKNSVVNHFIAELRNVDVQNDRMRFRKNLERIGEVAAFEISKTFSYIDTEVTTPLGIAIVPMMSEPPVLATILRAGLPLHQGLLNYFDMADNGFISAYRRHHKDGTFDIHLEYVACPTIENRILILSDPMLATGQSLVLTYKALMLKGKPKHTHIVTAIASTQGVAHVQANLSENLTIWCGAIDEELTSKSYIVPGLGDAGDLAFGKKD
ncbi:MAG: uracil phosphoribosyltransferase [Bacteroidia bacterium]